jgi:hypothetical protein
MTRKQYIFLIFCLLIQFSGKAQSEKLFFEIWECNLEWDGDLSFGILKTEKFIKYK